MVINRRRVFEGRGRRSGSRRLSTTGDLFVPFAEAIEVPKFNFAHITDLHLDVKGDSTWQYREKSVPLFIDAASPAQPAAEGLGISGPFPFSVRHNDRRDRGQTSMSRIPIITLIRQIVISTRAGNNICGANSGSWTQREQRPVSIYLRSITCDGARPLCRGHQ